MTATQETKTLLPRALDLLYHPIYHAEYRTVVAYRCELRINDPSLGVLLPKDYAPVALRSDRTSKLSYAHLSLCLADMERFTKRGVFYEFVSVPVAPRYLMKDGLTQDLAALLAEREVNPKTLCLTFPEQLLFEDEKVVCPLLDILRGMGVTLAIGDFGNPLSPVMRLQAFKVDKVFLHPNFAGDMAKASDDSSFMYICEMLNHLGMDMVAAGVDDSNTAARLLKRHCLYSEGKLAGKAHRASGVRA